MFRFTHESVKAQAESECIGHKRIIPLDLTGAGSVTIEITKSAGSVKIRDIAVYG